MADHYLTDENDDLVVPKRVYEELVAHASERHPEECCGLILGGSGQIGAISRSKNVHPDPCHRFEIDPSLLIEAYRSERAGGPVVMGFYHSHPVGAPLPSETDRALAAHDGRIWAIISGRSIMFWEDAPDHFHALSYRVYDG